MEKIYFDLECRLVHDNSIHWVHFRIILFTSVVYSWLIENSQNSGVSFQTGHCFPFCCLPNFCYFFKKVLTLFISSVFLDEVLNWRFSSQENSIGLYPACIQCMDTCKQTGPLTLSGVSFHCASLPSKLNLLHVNGIYLSLYTLLWMHLFHDFQMSYLCEI